MLLTRLADLFEIRSTFNLIIKPFLNLMSEVSCAFKSGPELIAPFTSVVLEMNVRWEEKHLNSVFLRVKAMKTQ